MCLLFPGPGVYNIRVKECLQEIILVIKGVLFVWWVSGDVKVYMHMLPYYIRIIRHRSIASHSLFPPFMPFLSIGERDNKKRVAFFNTTLFLSTCHHLIAAIVVLSGV